MWPDCGTGTMGHICSLPCSPEHLLLWWSFLAAEQRWITGRFNFLPIVTWELIRLANDLITFFWRGFHLYQSDCRWLFSFFFQLHFNTRQVRFLKNYLWPIVNYWTTNRLTINSKLKTQITRNGRLISGQRRRFEFNRLLTAP